MLPEPDEANEHTPQHCDHRSCANFFGCGDVKGIGISVRTLRTALLTVAPLIVSCIWTKSIRRISTIICRRADVGAASSCGQAASWGRLRQSTRGSPSLHEQVSLVQVASVNLMTLQGERM